MVHEISIKELKEIYPLLQKCYGFDYFEISKELDNCQSETLFLKTGEQTEIIFDDKDLNLRISIPVNDEFEKQKSSIINLCPNNEKAAKILVFMAAIFNRDLNGVVATPSLKSIRPEMLKLFVATNKLKIGESIFIAGQFGYPQTISNTDGWFSELVSNYLQEKLGSITLTEAKKELEIWNVEYQGRKARKPLRNYIILSTYNLINELVLPSNGVVTVEQCRLLQEYIKITGAIKEGNSAHTLNTLQASVNGYLLANTNAVEKHKIEIQKLRIIQ